MDGAGSTLNADVLDGLSSDKFMRTDQNTATTGSINVGGDISSDAVETNAIDVSGARGQTAVSVTGNVVLADNDLLGVQN